MKRGLNKGVAILVLVLCLLPVVNALGVQTEEIVGAVPRGGTAMFKLYVEQDTSASAAYYIEPQTIYGKWIANADPYLLQFTKRGIKTSNMLIHFTEDIPYGNHQIIVDIKDRDGKVLQSIPLIVNVAYETKDVSVKLDAPTVVVREPLEVTIDLENLKEVAFSNVDVRLKSDLFVVQKTIDLPANGGKTVNLVVDEFEDIGSGILEMEALVYSKDTIIGKDIADFEYVPGGSSIEGVEEQKNLLGRKIIVSKTNYKDEPFTDKIVLTYSYIPSLITKFTIPPTRKIGTIYEWEYTLQPGETFDLIAHTNYGLLFVYVIFLVVLAMGLGYLVKKKVVISKEIKGIKRGSDGISNLKVQLHIKNTGNYPVKDIKVMDHLPHFVKLDEGYGTLAPSRVQRGKRGKRVIWNMPALARGEERILTYNLKSKMTVIGKFVLPAAIVEYKTRSKRKVRNKSVRVTLMSNPKYSEEKKKR